MTKERRTVNLHKKLIDRVEAWAERHSVPTFTEALSRAATTGMDQLEQADAWSPETLLTHNLAFTAGLDDTGVLLVSRGGDVGPLHVPAGRVQIVRTALSFTAVGDDPQASALAQHAMEHELLLAVDMVRPAGWTVQTRLLHIPKVDDPRPGAGLAFAFPAADAPREVLAQLVRLTSKPLGALGDRPSCLSGFVQFLFAFEKGD